MSYDNNDQQQDYDMTGLNALRETSGGGAGEWLDFKQGRGDTHVVRIVNILGVRAKAGYKGAIKKVLEMDLELFESNGQVFNPPKMVRTNPTAHWCKPITACIDTIAKEGGWDGNERTYAQYAANAYGRILRMTRNDNEASKVGRIDCENIGSANDYQNTSEDQPFDTKENESIDSHVINIRGASTLEELKIIFTEAYRSTRDAELIAQYTWEKDQMKIALDNGLAF